MLPVQVLWMQNILFAANLQHWWDYKSDHKNKDIPPWVDISVQNILAILA